MFLLWCLDTGRSQSSRRVGVVGPRAQNTFWSEQIPVPSPVKAAGTRPVKYCGRASSTNPWKGFSQERGPGASTQGAGIKKTFVVRDYPGPQLWRTLSHLQPELKHYNQH